MRKCAANSLQASCSAPLAQRLCYPCAGLTAALELLKGIADEKDGVGYADVFQLASVTAIELAGGPKIPLRFGRKDAATEEDCVPEGRLPGVPRIR